MNGGPRQRPTFQRHERAGPRRLRLPTQTLDEKNTGTTRQMSLRWMGRHRIWKGFAKKFLREHTHSEDEVRVFVKATASFVSYRRGRR